MSTEAALRARLEFLAGVVQREAQYLRSTDSRLFGPGFGIADVAKLPQETELAERVDAFKEHFGRLQDTLAGGLLPGMLKFSLEPVGSVLDNLNRAERLGWVRSAADWTRLRLLRNRMVHEYVRDP